MERNFINSNFKYIRVVPISNGITWTCERLCNQITTSYLALDYHGEVFVWLDREGRTETSDAIRSNIRAALINSGADPNRIYILVNDRMTENVILSDESVIVDEFGLDEYLYISEGQRGKSILKTLYKEKDVNYKEMVHGCNLLKKIRLSNCAINSPAVSSFMEDCGLNCWWF